MQDSVASYFNQVAHSYENHFRLDNLQEIINLLDLASRKVIIEAGSGNSDFTQYLLPHISDESKIICIDIADSMIELAKKKIQDPRVTFIHADLNNYDLQQFKPDLVVCFNMLPHILDKNKFIKNIRKALAPNGSLVICHDRTRREVETAHKKHKVPKDIFDFPNNQEIMKLLTQNGFTLKRKIFEPFYYLEVIK